MDNDDKKWNLPDSLRVDLDTPESREMLEAANAQQIELAERFGGPFQASTPRSKMRHRATILIQEYSRLTTLSDAQNEELAESLAIVGMYELAVSTTQKDDRREEFENILGAIDLDDGVDCNHGSKNKVAAGEVYSTKHSSDVVLLRCTVCQDVNAVPAPEFLKAARSRRQEIRAKYTGLKPLEALAAMQRDGVEPT